jgi:hypothetical protein
MCTSHYMYLNCLFRPTISIYIDNCSVYVDSPTEIKPTIMII